MLVAAAPEEEVEAAKERSSELWRRWQTAARPAVAASERGSVTNERGE